MLDAVLSRLPRPTDPNVLVGYDTSDDAGVYLLAPELAIVQTVDFFTPIVDDPFTFGAIAAANSLSDVYAMGGRPVSALSIVAFPPNGNPEVMEQIIRGGLSKMDEAGCSVVGGHSIRDDELKFGYAVTGVIHPQRVWRNVGAQPGDALIFTKALGTGLISTALKNGKASDESLAASTASMMRLNKDAAEALLHVEAALRRAEDAGLKAGATKGESAIHAVTDITGFGLLGHAKEMAAGSKVSLEIDHTKIPALPGALDAARAGHLAGGLKNNREWLEGCVEFAASVPEEMRCLLFDPQTSGGLLVAIAAERADAALAALAARKVPAQIIGSVLGKRSPLIHVV
ncbi:MAG: selenide, water dikinase SelD [Acidobacteria bacterium]|nr:selenide, water dikinase SelD [Acidobacteriota bacterium]MCL5288573.1 selenide, water dikinase SelD [Acidobacteriota bacterium]